MYYDTTHLPSAELKQAKRQASDQDAAVMRCFEAFGESTPSGVWQNCISNGWIGSGTPLTSIRRSITGLTNKGELTKTGEQRKGIYGKPEYVWALPVREPKQLRIV